MSKIKESVSVKLKLPVEMYLKFKRICDDQCQPINDFFRQKISEVLLSCGKIPPLPIEQESMQESMQEDQVDMVVKGFKPDEPEEECEGRCKHKNVNRSRL